MTTPSIAPNAMRPGPAAQGSISPVGRRDGLYVLNLRELAGWLPVLVLAYPFIVWPMAFSAFNVSTGGGTELSNIEASSSNAINVLYFLAVGGLAVLLAGPRLAMGQRMIWTGALLVLVAYLALAAASTVWALNTSISMRRLILQGLVVVSTVFAVLVEDDPRRLARRLFWLALLTVALNIAWLGVKPPSPLGVEGIYPQQNVLGAVLLVILPILIYALVTSRGMGRLLAVGGLAGTFVLLVLSESKTSLGLAIVVPSFVLAATVAARTLRTTPATLIWFGLLTIYLSWLLVSQVSGMTLDDLSELTFGDPTFTGRTYIWEFIGQQIDNRPALGYGFNSFWAVGYDSPSFREAPGFIISLLQSHSGYLDTRIETGIVGFALLIALIALAMNQTSALVRRDRPLAFMCMSLVLLAVLHNLLESSFFRNYNAVWVGFLIAIAISTPRLRVPGSAPATSLPGDEADDEPETGIRTALPEAR